MASFSKLATLGTATGPQPNIRPPIQQLEMAEPNEGHEPGEGTKREEAEDMREQGQGFAPTGDAPPTARDHKQSIAHHISSIKYNARHAAAHQEETAKHSTALLNLLKNVPGFAEHARKV